MGTIMMAPRGPTRDAVTGEAMMGHGHNGRGETVPELRAESLGALETELEELRAQVERLAAIDKLKSDFLNLATHELRSPLAIINGYVQMIDSGVGGEVPPRLRRMLDPIARNVELMTQLVNELMETSRLDESQIERSREHIDVRELIEDASTPVTRSSVHHLTLELGDAPAPVLADRGQLLRVLGNLVDNALKYSPQGGEISIAVRQDGGDVHVDVVDSGIGIAEADQPRLFTRFGRIINDQTRGIAGTGLGLYLCREIVRRHGGEVTASSEPGSGSRFTVRLPSPAAVAPPGSPRRVSPADAV